MKSAVAILLLFVAAAAQGQFTLRARSRPEITWVYLSYSPVSGASWYVLKRASVYPNWDAGINVGTSTTVGTGLTATPEMAQEAHSFIKSLLDAPVLYGGSVKADNAAGILAQADVDGALVGGASLDVDSFRAICETAARIPS